MERVGGHGPSVRCLQWHDYRSRHDSLRGCCEVPVESWRQPAAVERNTGIEPRLLINNNNHNIAPRVGIAWDVFGNGKTALRFGGGQFYQRELVGIDEGMARTAPFVIGVNTNRSLDTPTSLANPAVSPNYGKNPRGVVPNAWQWNISTEQQLTRNTTIETGYVGNTGVHLTSMYDLNPIPQSNWAQSVFASGAAPKCIAAGVSTSGPSRRLRPWRRTVRAYHSLQTLFRSQLGPSTFQVAYTWSPLDRQRRRGQLFRQLQSTSDHGAGSAGIG